MLEGDIYLYLNIEKKIWTERTEHQHLAGENSKEDFYKTLQEANQIDQICMRQNLHEYPSPFP